MNISYDATVDALYIKLIPGDLKVECRNVDEDVTLNFDELDRLVGIEVLDATHRLDFHHLLPVEVTWDSNDTRKVDRSTPVIQKPIDWDQLVHELLARKEAGVPVETVVRGSKNWVEEVGDDYVVVRRDNTGNTVKTTRRALEGRTRRMLSVTHAILKLLVRVQGVTG